MAKNIIADVARLLGVELEEEFEIKNMGFIYKFTEDGLFYRIAMGEDEDWYTDLADLTSLICGNLEIVKFPWKPKEDEGYWHLKFVDGDYIKAGYNIWCSDTVDYMYYNLNLIYRTREEAEAHLREDYQKLMGKEWEE